MPDERFDYGEARYVAYGRVEGGAKFVIAFTPRANAYRIISIRPFGRKEIELYGE